MNRRKIEASKSVLASAVGRAGTTTLVAVTGRARHRPFVRFRVVAEGGGGLSLGLFFDYLASIGSLPERGDVPSVPNNLHSRP